MSASESEDLDFDDEQEDQVRKSRMWQKYINDFFLTKIYSKVFFLESLNGCQVLLFL